MRLLIAVMSFAGMAAMAYVGAYQSRQIDHLECPAFGHGCEAVADAEFARPFGLPDDLGAGLYALTLLSLAGTTRRFRTFTFALAIIVAASNALGIFDMARFGAWCFWCVATTVLAVPLVVVSWRWRAGPHRSQ